MDPTLSKLATAGEADGLADLAFVDLAGAAADDRLGILANRALCGGGVLAVLTHCHHAGDNPITDDGDQTPAAIAATATTPPPRTTPAGTTTTATPATPAGAVLPTTG